ncbi:MULTISPECIES: type VI secretion system contractile sheath small subunit [unclassified Pseudomonas]|uniref:type VI secretion system contractile sheath small subunit n=1 Tax=unclassified Pseudomonas TaxID=196821 RepID=UPI000BC5000C|nr:MULTISPECIES: type VI secretion system contractile sheath small subunit [unclassified Pseudomonas]PVZ19624.1 type VI secretion system protein ImpB [Pseudomonas sp. URIL14HWK12:I12]PVZ22791.1 type VI secretion system protein ImpB [Pseudomonas sp. URIL14HWK12:I10]PVZ37579.1 type VI secretion system protein ImpB [Pseudomonas sp. URIL14HWK12:I11]SNZ15166.1 type VI secretion system protein ImpB [Pseudomonas sp. URIL14HWK12:I9]
MSSRSFQHEVPKARVNIKLDVHTGGAQQKVELPLKLLMLADYSNGREHRPLAERAKVSVNRNNFDSVLADYAPRARFDVANALADGHGDWALNLGFNCMKDFEPEQVARQVPQLRALLAMRNLLRDLKSNLLDNATFRAELERILLDPQLNQGLRSELARLEQRA